MRVDATEDFVPFPVLRLCDPTIPSEEQPFLYPTARKVRRVRKVRKVRKVKGELG